jgi:hypothetical protein
MTRDEVLRAHPDATVAEQATLKLTGGFQWNGVAWDSATFSFGHSGGLQGVILAPQRPDTLAVERAMASLYGAPVRTSPYSATFREAGTGNSIEVGTYGPDSVIVIIRPGRPGND